jgi:YVTN family beta-propeller protein
MRALRMLLSMVVVLSVVVPTAQAKTNYAYVANDGDGTVSVIDTNTNLVVKTITVGSGPWGVAVNQAGHLRVRRQRCCRYGFGHQHQH